MSAKPHLKVVLGQPVEVPKRESPLAAARRRAGGTFGWERQGFKWEQGATVLTPEWVAQQKANRRNK